MGNLGSSEQLFCIYAFVADADDPEGSEPSLCLSGVRQDQEVVLRPFTGRREPDLGDQVRPMGEPDKVR
jgi:hypothetical protein